MMRLSTEAPSLASSTGIIFYHLAHHHTIHRGLLARSMLSYQCQVAKRPANARSRPGNMFRKVIHLAEIRSATNNLKHCFQREHNLFANLATILADGMEIIDIQVSIPNLNSERNTILIPSI